MKREHLLRKVGDSISRIELPHTVRIGIDGIDAAGKSTFAKELAESLAGSGFPVIRASIDDFHNPEAIRYRKGRLSPDGYYEDSFNYPVIISRLLEPLGPSGDGVYQLATFDYQADRARVTASLTAPERAILLFDGVFLHRPELRAYWDRVLFLDISFNECLARALDRDSGLIGPAQSARTRYLERYIPGQKLYLAECRPKQKSDVVIDNEKPLHPKLIRFNFPVYPDKFATRMA